MANTLDQAAWMMMDQTGTCEEAFTSAKREKKRPSRAIANGTRALDKINPLSAPSAERIKAIEMSFPPQTPRNVCAALVATGNELGWTVELEVTTSANGSA